MFHHRRKIGGSSRLFIRAILAERTTLVSKRRTDVDVECTEDGRDGRIGATAEHENGRKWKKKGRKADGLTWTGTESNYGCEGRIDEF